MFNAYVIYLRYIFSFFCHGTLPFLPFLITWSSVRLREIILIIINIMQVDANIMQVQTTFLYILNEL